jgi:hypothetical protein
MTSLQYCVAVIRGRGCAAVVLGSAPGTQKPRSMARSAWASVSALGGIRTPNLLIRSQMLYPLSYERRAR